MKLVIATPLYPPEIGGPATYAKALEEGLPGKGIEVELVKFSDVRHLPKMIRHLAYYRRVLAAARCADLVLALDPVSTGLPAMRAAKRVGKPFVVKVVGDYAWEQGRQRFGVGENLDDFVRSPQKSFFVRRLQAVQTRVARCASRVIVPSEYLRKIVLAWGVSAEKVEVIYNAVPMEMLGNVPGTVAKLPRPLVVTAGRLVPWKNIDGVIDAVASIPGASLVIVGDGPDRAALMRRAEEKLRGRVAFTGQLSHADTLAVMKSADAFVLNSSYEGLSHLLIEAQALGIPTIATDVGGNPEVITNGENGLLVPAGSARSLADSLAQLLGDAQLRVRFSANARASAERFSSGRMIAATSQLMLDLRNPT
jgi:glycosyltransferase involved in cell wall biosynthesis